MRVSLAAALVLAPRALSPVPTQLSPPAGAPEECESMGTPASVQGTMWRMSMALLCTVACAAGLSGQEMQPLAAGQLVRIDTATAQSGGHAELVRGKFLFADSGRIDVDPDGPGQHLPIPRASVRRLEVRTVRSGAVSGMKAGFLIGAGSAAAIGAYMLVTGWDAGDVMSGTAMMAGVFGGAAALVGAAIGAAARPEVWRPAQMPAPAP